LNGMDDLEFIKIEVPREEVDTAYAALQEMYDFFQDWFPFEGGDDREQMAERFAVTKLNLEIAEYSYEDLEYLRWIRTKTSENKEYSEALGLFIRVLSEEFGSSYW